MDWDSPTTKKHIAEAEAQGCELVSDVSKPSYHLYRLPCGHEQVVHIQCMRKGGFRCQTCFEETLRNEARDQGCLLLGVADKNSYRLYKLPCGHTKEIPILRMRNGSFRCSTCLEEKHRSEAEAEGCVLLGVGESGAPLRLYSLPCGHEQEINPAKMRIGAWECQTCFVDKLIAEAEAQGCKVIGPGKKWGCRKYLLSCGHEQEVDVGCMRSGSFRCQACVEEKHNEEAEKHGCRLLGPGSSRHWRNYELACGHEQELTLANVRSGEFRCRTCHEDKLKEHAATQGFELLGAGRTSRYRRYLLPCGHMQEFRTGHVEIGVARCQTCLNDKFEKEAKARGCEYLGAARAGRYGKYRLPCGHVQEIALFQMRSGSFRCQTCEDYFYTQPSQVYLLHIKLEGYEWLKLGYAKDIDFRTTRYGLPTGAEVALIATVPFNTGKEANSFEQLLHKKHKRKRLKARDMAEFHRIGGHTECYPVTMVETLLAHFRDPK